MIKWEEAPEGTTHFYRSGGGEWWLKRDGNVYEWWSLNLAPGWRGKQLAGGGGNFGQLDPRTLYEFGSQAPIGDNQVGIPAPQQQVEAVKPKVGWW